MKTHWKAVWNNRNHRALSLFSSAACCGRASSTTHSTFPGLGFEPQSRHFFVMWLQWQLISINQWIKLFKTYSPLIDRCRKLGEGKKAKKLPRLGFGPQTWKCEIGCGTGTGTARCRGQAPYDCLLLHTVFQWVFIRRLAFSTSR